MNISVQSLMKATPPPGAWCLCSVTRDGRRLITLWRGNGFDNPPLRATNAFPAQHPEKAAKLPVTFAPEANTAFSPPVRVRRPRAARPRIAESLKSL